MPSAVFASLLAVALALGAAAQEIGADARRHFLAARQAQDQGDLDTAVREYLAVVRTEPALPQVYANLGIVYHFQSKFLDSARALEKAEALQPGLRGVSLFLGIDYVKCNQARRAIPFLRKAVAQEPQNKDALSWLSSSLWETGQPEAALAELNRAVRAVPNDTDLLFLLGDAYQKSAQQELDRVTAESLGSPLYHQVFGDLYVTRHNWQRATRHYRRASEKDPRWRGAHLGLGVVYVAQDKLDEAQGEFRKELEIDPKSAAAHAQLAEISLLRGETAAALTELNAAIRIAPEQAADALGLPRLSPSAAPQPPEAERAGRYKQALAALEGAPDGAARRLAIAAVCLRLGMNDRSAEQWRLFQADMKRPAVPLALFEQARASYWRHDFATAESELRRVLAASPKRLEARYLLARTFQQFALAVLDRVLVADPDSYRAHQLLAEVYQQQDLNDRALAEYRIVEQKSPGLAGLHYSIGCLLWKTGETAQALEELRRELQSNPASAAAAAEIGTILVTGHQQDEAIPYLQKALELNPGLVAARQQLGKAYYQRKDYARAASELAKSVSSDPDGSMHYILGVVYRELGRAEESKAALAEARTIKAESLARIRIDEEQP